ncbi:hypothetical protein GCM10010508_61940 [Streptomyces naganishii JCM 4654]|uniref:Uncharacterized protein n=1 Tax=Streptomyces naganishii JCM 4654 TaxID=1306179 RepID=A0A919CYW0_9ACTN|nr:hypothetical protein GCM10010508_61940 [Streptomyces naganishii JCM 4654]
MAQQPQWRQLQRARAAPWDPAVRVGVSAEFASMPTRTAVHTSTVNSTPGMWDMFHLIRFISQVKGLLTRGPGHMAHMPGTQAPLRSRDPTVIRFASARVSERDRSPGRPSRYGPVRVPRRTRDTRGSRLRVKVYADLNTFRMALVPQSE